MVKANALDLAQFQFDWDLTFAVFFMNPDGTIYGRFGTRSDGKEAAREITIEGFQKALEGALALHKEYPSNRAALAGKRGLAPRFKTPDDFPSLKGKYQPTLNYEDNPVKSCLHCHMIGEASRKVFREARQPLPDRVLHPWPMPDLLGLTLDPREKARVSKVAPGSAAASAGFEARDEILSIEGQPILSIADVQWTLHNAAEPSPIKAVVQRGNERVTLTLPLKNGWRRESDISWRPTTWDLRRMGTGGLLLDELPAAERARANLPDDRLALLVKHVGQYGEHATAMRAGFKKGDVVVAWDGLTGHLSETDVIAHVMRGRMIGQKIPVTVLRDGRRIEMQLEMK